MQTGGKFWPDGATFYLRPWESVVELSLESIVTATVLVILHLLARRRVARRR